MVYPLALYRVLDNYSNKNDKMVGAVAATFIGGAIVFTYSRAALMVFMAITFFILLERRINIIKVGIVVCAILILAIPVLPKGYLERMGSIVGIGGAADGEADESSTGRASEALVAIQMFLDHPIMGIGYGRYEPNYLDYSIYLGLDSRLEDRQAHNMYLEAAAETGIVGLLLLFFMFGTIFYAIYRARQQLPQIGRPDLIPWLAALQFGLLAYLLSSIFLHDDYVRYLRLSTGLAVSSTALVEALIAQQAAKRERERLAQYDEEVPKLANTY
jgi:O-antigen ligase